MPCEPVMAMQNSQIFSWLLGTAFDLLSCLLLSAPHN